MKIKYKLKLHIPNQLKLQLPQNIIFQFNQKSDSQDVFGYF